MHSQKVRYIARPGLSERNHRYVSREEIYRVKRGDLQKTGFKDAQEHTTNNELAVRLAKPSETGDDGPTDGQSRHYSRVIIRLPCLGVSESERGTHSIEKE